MNSPALTLPALVVKVNGQALDPDLVAALAEVQISLRLSRPAQCELAFLDAPAGAGDLLVPGATLDVELGGETGPVFAGEITATEFGYGPAQGRELRVRGYDRLHRLRKRQPVRAHVQVGLEELTRELVADLGLTLSAPLSAGALLWPRLIQHGQTNLELLDEITEASGLFYSLRDSTLHLFTLEGESEGDPLPLRLGDSLLEARVEANGDRSCRSVSFAGWDPLRVERRAGGASTPRVGRRVAAEVSPAAIGGAEERTLVAQAVQNDRQAQALAQAELDQRAAREVTLWAVAEGNPRLRPGAVVTLDGAEGSFNGSYVLTSVIHRVDAQQRFVSELSTCPPPPRPKPAGASVALGVVTRVDDPEGIGRVQVSLPAFDGVQTDWMQVLMLGAGAKKGLMILPDVGDQVAVLCAQEDPAQGLVLGGLYGVSGPPDSGVEHTAVKRYTLQTPGGQRVLLDDAKRLVRIEHDAGTFVEMTPSKLSLHARGDLHISAPGHTVTIAGKAIQFEEA